MREINSISIPEDAPSTGFLTEEELKESRIAQALSNVANSYFSGDTDADTKQALAGAWLTGKYTPSTDAEKRAVVASAAYAFTGGKYDTPDFFSYLKVFEGPNTEKGEAYVLPYNDVLGKPIGVGNLQQGVSIDEQMEYAKQAYKTLIDGEKEGKNARSVALAANGLGEDFYDVSYGERIKRVRSQNNWIENAWTDNKKKIGSAAINMVGYIGNPSALEKRIKDEGMKTIPDDVLTRSEAANNKPMLDWLESTYMGISNPDVESANLTPAQRFDRLFTALTTSEAASFDGITTGGDGLNSNNDSITIPSLLTMNGDIELLQKADQMVASSREFKQWQARTMMLMNPDVAPIITNWAKNVGWYHWKGLGQEGGLAESLAESITKHPEGSPEREAAQKTAEDVLYTLGCLDTRVWAAPSRDDKFPLAVTMTNSMGSLLNSGLSMFSEFPRDAESWIGESYARLVGSEYTEKELISQSLNERIRLHTSPQLEEGVFGSSAAYTITSLMGIGEASAGYKFGIATARRLVKGGKLSSKAKELSASVAKAEAEVKAAAEKFARLSPDEFAAGGAVGAKASLDLAKANLKMFSTALNDTKKAQTVLHGTFTAFDEVAKETLTGLMFAGSAAEQFKDSIAEEKGFGTKIDGVELFESKVNVHAASTPLFAIQFVLGNQTAKVLNKGGKDAEKLMKAFDKRFRKVMTDNGVPVHGVPYDKLLLNSVATWLHRCTSRAAYGAYFGATNELSFELARASYDAAESGNPLDALKKNFSLSSILEESAKMGAAFGVMGALPEAARVRRENIGMTAKGMHDSVVYTIGKIASSFYDPVNKPESEMTPEEKAERDRWTKKANATFLELVGKLDATSKDKANFNKVIADIETQYGKDVAKRIVDMYNTTKKVNNTLYRRLGHLTMTEVTENVLKASVKALVGSGVEIKITDAEGGGYVVGLEIENPNGTKTPVRFHVGKGGEATLKPVQTSEDGTNLWEKTVVSELDIDKAVSEGKVTQEEGNAIRELLANNDTLIGIKDTEGNDVIQKVIDATGAVRSGEYDPNTGSVRLPSDGDSSSITSAGYAIAHETAHAILIQLKNLGVLSDADVDAVKKAAEGSGMEWDEWLIFEGQRDLISSTMAVHDIGYEPQSLGSKIGEGLAKLCKGVIGVVEAERGKRMKEFKFMNFVEARIKNAKAVNEAREKAAKANAEYEAARKEVMEKEEALATVVGGKGFVMTPAIEEALKSLGKTPEDLGFVKFEGRDDYISPLHSEFNFEMFKAITAKVNNGGMDKADLLKLSTLTPEEQEYVGIVFDENINIVDWGISYTGKVMDFPKESFDELSARGLDLIPYSEVKDIVDEAIELRDARQWLAGALGRMKEVTTQDAEARRAEFQKLMDERMDIVAARQHVEEYEAWKKDEARKEKLRAKQEKILNRALERAIADEARQLKKGGKRNLIGGENSATIDELSRLDEFWDLMKADAISRGARRIGLDIDPQVHTDIWKKTGWFLNLADFSPRVEFNPPTFDLSNFPSYGQTQATGLTMSDILTSSEDTNAFLDRYTTYDRVPLEFRRMDAYGQMDLNGMTINATLAKATRGFTKAVEESKNTLLHETQHFIQGQDNLGLGSSPVNAFITAKDSVPDALSYKTAAIGLSKELAKPIGLLDIHKVISDMDYLCSFNSQLKMHIYQIHRLSFDSPLTESEIKDVKRVATALNNHIFRPMANEDLNSANKFYSLADTTKHQGSITGELGSFEAYENISGETEAREAADRDMNPDTKASIPIVGDSDYMDDVYSKRTDATRDALQKLYEKRFSNIVSDATRILTRVAQQATDRRLDMLRKSRIRNMITSHQGIFSFLGHDMEAYKKFMESVDKVIDDSLSEYTAEGRWLALWERTKAIEEKMAKEGIKLTVKNADGDEIDVYPRMGTVAGDSTLRFEFAVEPKHRVTIPKGFFESEEREWTLKDFFKNADTNPFFKLYPALANLKVVKTDEKWDADDRTPPGENEHTYRSRSAWFDRPLLSTRGELDKGNGKGAIHINIRKAATSGSQRTAFLKDIQSAIVSAIQDYESGNKELSAETGIRTGMMSNSYLSRDLGGSEYTNPVLGYRYLNDVESFVRDYVSYLYSDKMYNISTRKHEVDIAANLIKYIIGESFRHFTDRMESRFAGDRFNISKEALSEGTSYHEGQKEIFDKGILNPQRAVFTPYETFEVKGKGKASGLTGTIYRKGFGTPQGPISIVPRERTNKDGETETQDALHSQNYRRFAQKQFDRFFRNVVIPTLSSVMINAGRDGVYDRYPSVVDKDTDLPVVVAKRSVWSTADLQKAFDKHVEDRDKINSRDESESTEVVEQKDVTSNFLVNVVARAVQAYTPNNKTAMFAIREWLISSYGVNPDTVFESYLEPAVKIAMKNEAPAIEKAGRIEHGLIDFIENRLADEEGMSYKTRNLIGSKMTTEDYLAIAAGRIFGQKGEDATAKFIEKQLGKMGIPTAMIPQQSSDILNKASLLATGDLSQVSPRVYKQLMKYFKKPSSDGVNSIIGNTLRKGDNDYFTNKALDDYEDSRMDAARRTPKLNGKDVSFSVEMGLGINLINELYNMGSEISKYSNAEELAIAIENQWKQSYAHKNRGVTLPEIEDSYEARSEWGETVAALVEHLSKKALFGKSRESGVIAAAKLRAITVSALRSQPMHLNSATAVLAANLDSVGSVLRKYGTINRNPMKGDVVIGSYKLIERIKKYIDDNADGSKRVSESMPNIDRKVSPRVQSYWRHVKDSLSKNPDKVAARIAELEASLGVDASALDQDYMVSDENVSSRDDMRLELMALSRYGGLSKKLPGEVDDALREIASDISGRIAEHEAIVQRKRDYYARAVDSIESSLRKSSAYKPSDRDKGRKVGLGRSFLMFNVPDLFSRLRMDIEEDSQAYEFLSDMERDFSYAERSRITDSVFRETELREAVSKIFGDRFDKVMTRLSIQDPSLARFSTALNLPSLSRAQLMYIYAIARQGESIGDSMYENNIRFGRDSVYLSNIRAELTDKELAMCDWMSAKLDEIRLEISPVCESITGMPVRSPHEKYFHVIYKDDIKARTQRNFDVSRFPGFLKSRTTSSKPLDEHSNIFSVYLDSIQSAMHYKHYAELTETVVNVMKNSRVTDAYAKTTGTKYMNKMLEQLSDSLSGGRVDMDDWFAILRRIVTHGSLFYNIPSAFRQLEGVTGWGVSIGNIGVVRAVLSNMFSPSTWEAINEVRNSSVIGARLAAGFSEPIDDIIQAGRKGGWSAAIDPFSSYLKNGMIVHRQMDLLASLSCGGWYYKNKFNEYRNQGLDVETARKKALSDVDIAIQMTQSSGRQPYLHEWQRGGTAGRIAAQFAGPTLIRFGQEIESLHRAWTTTGGKNKLSAFKKLFSRLFALHVVVPAAYNMLDFLCQSIAPSVGNEDEDELKERMMMQLVMSMITGSARNMLLMGGAVEALSGRIAASALDSDAKTYKRMGGSPLVQYVNRTIGDTTALFEAVNGYAADEEDMEEVMKCANKLSRDLFPLWRFINNIQRKSEED